MVKHIKLVTLKDRQFTASLAVWCALADFFLDNLIDDAATFLNFLLHYQFKLEVFCVERIVYKSERSSFLVLEQLAFTKDFLNNEIFNLMLECWCSYLAR